MTSLSSSEKKVGEGSARGRGYLRQKPGLEVRMLLYYPCTVSVFSFNIVCSLLNCTRQPVILLDHSFRDISLPVSFNDGRASNFLLEKFFKIEGNLQRSSYLENSPCWMIRHTQTSRANHKKCFLTFHDVCHKLILDHFYAIKCFIRFPKF